MPNRIDAEDIANEAWLLRRIDARMLDRTANAVQTWAWQDQNNELSVYVAAETTEARVLSLGKPGQIIIRITAGSVRKLGHIVVRDPEPDEPSHCIIYPHPSRRISKKMCERSAWD